MLDAQTLLDRIPSAGVFILVVVLNLVVFEVAFRVGRWRKQREPDQVEGASGVLVGSMLALLAFLLAVTMGMAADRFNIRSKLVTDEATTIGTAFLRAGYLSEPFRTDIRNLLRDYVPLRIVPEGGTLAGNVLRSEDIHRQLWDQTEAVVAEDQSATTALFVDSVNELIDLHTERLTAAITLRVPSTVVAVLVILAVVSIGMVGYNAGLSRRRTILSATLLIVALGGVITVVVDLDRPREGLVQVSQQPLIELQRDLGPPEP